MLYTSVAYSLLGSLIYRCTILDVMYECTVMTVYSYESLIVQTE